VTKLGAWNDTAATKAIVEFVETAARELPPEERPEVVDKLSPEGQLPSDDAIRSELAKP
jgi:uncharacterized protein YidB (DUF937 family)